MRRSIRFVAILVSVGLVLGVAPAFAQQRPLVTEDPEVIGAGRLLIEAGVDVEHDVYYPLSGLRGNRVSAPTIGISVGLSSIAEIQIDGGLYQRLEISERRAAPLAGLLEITGPRSSDVDDMVIATKIRLFGETATGRPALGFRFATKLPNASNEAGLGSDMTDFFASFLIAKTIQSVRVVGNGGVAILGDPVSEDVEQHDFITFGLSVARAMTTATEIVGELNARLNLADDAPVAGAESRATVRVGGRYTRGTVRLDVAALIGMTPRDPQIGATLGFTWVFNAFRVP